MMQEGRLSEHFAISEFERSSRAIRLGIPNVMTKPSIANAVRLCAELEKLRAYLRRPVTITSGYRSPELNAQTPGASRTSAHMEGRAADIVVEGMTNRELMLALDAAGVDYDQAIDEMSGGGAMWVHVGVARDGEVPRRQRLTQRPGRGYEPFAC